MNDAKTTVVMRASGRAGMSFGAALAALREGRSVRREGWNGKGMFLFYVGENEWRLPDTSVEPGRILPLAAFIALRAADEKVVPWTPSQTDILAWDWREVGA